MLIDILSGDSEFLCTFFLTGSYSDAAISADLELYLTQDQTSICINEMLLDTFSNSICECNYVGTIPDVNLGYNFTGLTIDTDDWLYFNQNNSLDYHTRLVKYNPEDGNYIILDTFNLWAWNDITFYDGYLLFPTSDNPPMYGNGKMRLYDIETKNFIDSFEFNPVSLAFNNGFSSIATPCHSDIVVYVRENKLWKFDFENLAVVELHDTPFNSFSPAIGASTSEYLASLPSLSIDTVYIEHPGCVDENSGGFTIKHRYMRGRGLKYELVGHYTQTDSIFTGLAEGDYVVNMIDTIWGCDFLSDTIRLRDLVFLAPDAISTERASCDSMNGKVIIDPSGLDFEVSINGSDFNKDTIFKDLSAGEHSLVFKYNEACFDTILVSIDKIDSPILFFTSYADHCLQGSGKIEINQSTGLNPLSWKFQGGDFENETLFDQLESGTYSLTVKDSVGCEIEYEINIEATAGPNVDDIILIPSGCTSETGSITVNASGNSDLDYNLNGGAWQEDNEFINLGSGDYDIIVRDSAGCIAETSAMISTTSDPFIETINIEDEGCDMANGSLLVSASGTSVLEYSVDGTNWQSDSLFNNLASGNYIIFVRDEGGCEVNENATIGTKDDPIIADFEIEEAGCTVSNGTIFVSASGNSVLDYSLDGVTWQSDSLFSNLASGDYTIFVRDEGGCETSENASIGTKDDPVIADFMIEKAGCTVSDGILLISAAGNSVLEYSLDGISWQSDSLFSNLASGEYTIFVRDEGGCEVNENATIGTKDDPIISDFEIEEAGCTVSNGTLLISASGNSILEYSLDGVTWQSDSLFKNLASGEYTIFVRDEGGCEASENATIGKQDDPIIAEIEMEEAGCMVSDGSLLVSASGNSVLEYSLDGFSWQSDSLFSNLAYGEYTIFVRDEGGCEASENATIGTKDDPVIADFEIEEAGCTVSNGSLLVSASGNSVLEYSLDGFSWQSDSLFSNLASGEFTVFVRDEGGCETSKNVTIETTEEPVISEIITEDAACDQATGSLTITASGNSGLEYRLDGENWQNEAFFTDLVAGNYTIWVRDEGGCLSSEATTLSNTDGPEILAVEVENDHCEAQTGSFTITMSDNDAYEYRLASGAWISENIFSGLAAGTYALEVRDESGCVTLQSVVVEDILGPSIISIDLGIAKCGQAVGEIDVQAEGGEGMLSYSLDNNSAQMTGLFENLAGGTYLLEIRDQANCLTDTLLQIRESENPEIAILNIQRDSCGQGGGSFSYEVVAGTLPFSIFFDGETIQNTGFVSNLTSGDYLIQVRDSLNCVSSREIRIEDKTIGFYELETEQVHCSGTSVMSIVGLEEDAQVYINEQTFSYSELPLLEPGVYRISIPAESEGCEWNETVIIQESTCPEEEPGSVWFPNVFSPNFDGYNDEFAGIVHNAEVMELSIYDRWGQTVFQSKSGEAWKGVNGSGQAADQGVYVYFAVIRKADGQRTVVGGDVTLVR